LVARSIGLLVHEPDVSRLGFRHRWLRNLGGGWQMLETSGWKDPPDLGAATGAMAARTGSPVFAGYVCDSDCAALHAAVPGAIVSVAHIPDVTSRCRAFKHVPQPTGRRVSGVVDDLVAWARAAGLAPSSDEIRRALPSHRQTAAGYRSADDLVFDIVAGLGFDQIGTTVRYTFNVESSPFSRITDGLAGLGVKARSYAAEREYDIEHGLPVDEPEEPWESEAIALDVELWSAIYDPSADVAALARRAEWVEAAYRAARAGRPAPESPLDESPVKDNHRVTDRLHDSLVAGTLNPDMHDYARKTADERGRPGLRGSRDPD